MTKRVTANKAGHIFGTQYDRDYKAEAADKAKMAEVVKLVKTLKCRGRDFATATKVAKRAYQMGVRSVFAN